MKAEFERGNRSPIVLRFTTGTYGLSIEDARALAIELDKAIAQAEAVRDFARDLLAMTEDHPSDDIWEMLRKEYADC